MYVCVCEYYMCEYENECMYMYEFISKVNSGVCMYMCVCVCICINVSIYVFVCLYVCCL